LEIPDSATEIRRRMNLHAIHQGRDSMPGPAVGWVPRICGKAVDDDLSQVCHPRMGCSYPS
jgi:hypothetical protein